jgi:RimJ/RimL family protein N-acetyltransferase
MTERLLLRPFDLSDSKRVKLLAGDKAIASTTLNIPHPYEAGMAEEWIGTHQEGFEKGELYNFAIEIQAMGELIGAIGLVANPRHVHAELGYWIGESYWNRGYCTEAAREIVRYGFDELNLHRIHAMHLSRNPASGRVMRNIGMRHEGCRRQHVKKWDIFEDVELYGILRSD